MPGPASHLIVLIAQGIEEILKFQAGGPDVPWFNHRASLQESVDKRVVTQVIDLSGKTSTQARDLIQSAEREEVITRAVSTKKTIDILNLYTPKRA